MFRDHSPELTFPKLPKSRDCYLEMLFTFAQQALERTI